MTESMEARVRRLEDRVDIGELVTRYCLAMDNRDVDAIPALFTPDASLRSARRCHECRAAAMQS